MSGIYKVPVTSALRRFFYFVSPNETSFEHVEEVPRYLDEQVPFFVSAVIIEALICQVKGWRGPRINDGITSIAAGIVSVLPLLLILPIEQITYTWGYNNLRLIDLPWDSPWTWWASLLLVDMGYYWFHRAAHEINIFWAAHQVHHSSEDYNLTTALRQSAFQRYLGSWLFYLPWSLFIPPSVHLVHIQFNTIYQFWIHTEIVTNLGPLEYILNTPSHHRVHHGRNPYCIDKNYAGTLIIWDRLFGTFASEKEEVAYGLVHPINTWNPFSVQLCHFQYMWGRFWEEKGWSNKLSVIFKGPGWSPGTPRLGNHEDLPQVEFPVKRYDNRLSPWLNVYILTHFLLVILGYQELVAMKQGLSVPIILVFIAYIMLSLTAFGSLSDRSWYGPHLELLRCVLYLVGSLYQGLRSLEPRSVPHILLDVYFCFSACLWALACLRKPTSGKVHANGTAHVKEHADKIK